MTPGAHFGLAEASALGDRRTIPFDYAFRFDLTGKPNETLSRRIVISVEGAFTAVSLGYGVIARVQPIRFGADPRDFGPDGPFASVPPPENLGEIQLSHLVASLDRLAPAERDLVLKNGFRLSPDVASLSIGAALQPNVLSQAFEAIAAPPELIQFTYALFDDGSGREFQSAPILNTAGLGTANGERPFRYLAKPITFAPLAVIRMEITELSTVEGQLHVSLQGYKVLGGPATSADGLLPPAGQHPPRHLQRR
jgi:hypothetical protein